LTITGRVPSLVLSVLLSGAAPGVYAQSQPSGNAQALAAALAGMDQAAAGFRNASADLEYTKVTVIVNDHSTERGRIYFEKTKDDSRLMLAFSQPSEKYVLFDDDEVKIYRPKIAEIEEYSLAKNRGLLEQFLLLGFGTSGVALQKAYQVSHAGEEVLDGERTVKLALVPKSPDVVSRLQRIELWLSQKTWQPLQQKFYEPSKDYLVARYRNPQQNAKLSSDSFKLPVRGNVRTVRPQG
jgi:outer membrane lipoprotein-sorting protein